MCCCCRGEPSTLFMGLPSAGTAAINVTMTVFEPHTSPPACMEVRGRLANASTVHAHDGALKMHSDRKQTKTYSWGSVRSSVFDTLSVSGKKKQDCPWPVDIYRRQSHSCPREGQGDRKEQDQAWRSLQICPGFLNLTPIETYMCHLFGR